MRAVEHQRAESVPAVAPAVSVALTFCGDGKAIRARKSTFATPSP